MATGTLFLVFSELSVFPNSICFYIPTDSLATGLLFLVSSELSVVLYFLSVFVFLHSYRLFGDRLIVLSFQRIVCGLCDQHVLDLHPSGTALVDAQDAVEGALELHVGEVVHQPVQRRVHMGPHDDVQVRGVVERVVIVHDDDEGVGRPAGGEHDVDDKHGLAELETGREARGRVGLTDPRLVDPLTRGLHPEEDVQVGQADDDDGNPHEDDGEDDGVRVRRHAVPDALHALPVEGVVADAQEVEQSEADADGVEDATHEDAVPHGEDLLVVLVVADVHEPVEAQG